MYAGGEHVHFTGRAVTDTTGEHINVPSFVRYCVQFVIATHHAVQHYWAALYVTLQHVAVTTVSTCRDRITSPFL
jgi:hypothetical protein